MSRKGDLRNDKRCGFDIVTARDIDMIGVNGVINRLKARIGESKVYISVDIDVLDPSMAPGKLHFPLLFSLKAVLTYNSYGHRRSRRLDDKGTLEYSRRARGIEHCWWRCRRGRSNLRQPW